MRVVFTHGYFIAEDEKEQKIMRPYPPLGILYLSSWLEKHEMDNEVFDTTFSTKIEQQNYFKKNPPDVVAIYTNLMTKVNVIDLVKWMRTTKEFERTVIVLGGPDVTYNIEDYLNTGCNIIVIGEGEQTMLEIAQTVEKGNRSEFGHINGLAYRNTEGHIVRTDSRGRIRPVDQLPFPNRKKIPLQKYLDAWKKHHGMSAVSVSTQRGCPYTCKWCSTAVYGQSYRRRSPKVVVAELQEIKAKYNPDSLWFVDDVFTVSHKWLEEFAAEVVQQDAVIPFECITRADRMDEQVILNLKKAGAFRIWIGAESGSQRIIDAMDRRVDVAQVQNMIQLTRKHGLQAGTFIMLGYPGETESDIQETVDHLKISNPDLFTITIAYPIKGTGLYEQVEALQTKELNWEKTTDRDRDFKRTYSRKYYEYAVRWVTNEVRWHQLKLQGGSLQPVAIKHKLKAMALRSLMRYGK